MTSENKTHKLLTKTESFNMATDAINKGFEYELNVANYLFNLHGNHEQYNKDIKAASAKHYKAYMRAIKTLNAANKK